jgi:hypothetical protein
MECKFFFFGTHYLDLEHSSYLNTSMQNILIGSGQWARYLYQI